MGAAWRRTLGVALGAVALSGCVTASEFQQLEREVALLKQQASSQASGAAPTDTRLADLGAQVGDLEREVASLRGEVEEAKRMAEQAAAAHKNAPQSGAGTAPVASPSPPVPPSGAAAEVADYEAAFRLYRAADYRAAIDRFEAFLQNHPSSDYADNALFWVGECWFKLGDFEQAVLKFDEVGRKYPDGNKVPDARYRQGIALLEIGKRTHQEATYNPAAREIFEKLIEEHPDSERVPEARRQLEKLGS
ncbi:MAG: tol-pal system protein YbgF [Myxococcota bacterium]